MKRIIIIIVSIFILISVFANDVIVSHHSNKEINNIYINKYSGNIAIITNDNNIKILNKNTTHIESFYETSSKPMLVNWVDNNRYLVSANSDGNIDVFHRDSNFLNYKIRISEDIISDIDSDNEIIAFSSFDKSIYVYNVARRKLLYTTQTSSIPFSIALHSNYVFAGDSTGNVYKIDYINNKINQIKVGNSSVRNLFIADNDIFAFTFDGRLTILDQDLRVLDRISLENPILKVDFSLKNNYFSVLYSNNNIDIINTNTLNRIDYIRATNYNPIFMKWCKINENILYFGSDKNIYKKDVSLKTVEVFFESKSTNISQLDWIDNEIIFASDNIKLGFINSETGQISKFVKLDTTFNYYDIYKYEVITVDDRGFLAAHNLITGELQKMVKISNSKLTKVQFSPNGKYVAAGGWDNNVYVYSYPDLVLEKVIKTVHNNWIKDISFNSTGEFLAVSSLDKKVAIYKFPSMEMKILLDNFRYNIWSLDWSNSNNYLALGGFEGVIEIWDIAFNSRLLRTSIITGSINNLEWSSDDRYLLVGSEDKSIYLWNSQNGQLLNIINSQSTKVESIKWNKGGRYFVSSGEDNIIRFWDLSNNKNIANFMIFNDGKSVTFTNTGQYLTNIREEQNYFLRINPLGFFEVIKFQKVDNLKLREATKPTIDIVNEFIFTENNQIINISITSPNIIETIFIGDEKYSIKSSSFSMDYKIDLEKLRTNKLEIIVYDDSGNMAKEDVVIKIENVFLFVVSNQAFLRDSEGNVLGALTRGNELELLAIEENYYIVNFRGNRVYVEKAFMSIR